MKVAYITNSTLPLGGATKALRTLIDGLREYGVEPIVVVPDKQGIYETWRKDGINVYALNYREARLPDLNMPKDYIMFLPRFLGRRWLTRKAANELAQIVKDNNIDIIHTNSSVVEIGYLAAQKTGIPHIYHVREYGDLDFHIPYYPSLKTVNKRIAKGYSICITKGVQKHHRLDTTKKSQVIYDGVLSKRELPTGYSKGNYFLQAGRVEPAKGTDFTIRGYAEYAKRSSAPLPLWIAGDTFEKEYLNSLNAIIAKDNIQHLVKFLGPRKDINDLMRNAKATIISSEFEGFGFCMAEAMFNGCIVIGRNLAGTKEQFDNGLARHGKDIGLRCKTPEELGAQLLTVATKPLSEFDEMRTNAFETVNALYTAEHCAEQVYDIYKRILENY